MSDQFTKTRARAEKLAGLTDGIINALELEFEEWEPEAILRIEKLSTSLSNIHTAFYEERAYLNDMVDEGVLDEDALDFDEETE